MDSGCGLGWTQSAKADTGLGYARIHNNNGNRNEIDQAGAETDFPRCSQSNKKIKPRNGAGLVGSSKYEDAGENPGKS